MANLLTRNVMTRQQMKNFSTDLLRILHDPEKQQFYTDLNGEKAVLLYEKNGDSITLNHTGVPDVFRGKGVAALLAEEAFKYVRDNRLTMDLQCSYLQNHYVKNKTRYQDLKCVNKLS